ncbi:MAG: transcriptional regulator, AraC family [Ferruginibacter sp.]|uniref:helix-turn-helix transcriptional regulator n=1 Tax=Ferruginibacter sp. TaxID=1940288 RepID=UPI00265A30C4|nr:helix-turn-helix transcriptional regulator [Ferruginibacter sp.]MDB5280727.1 transcriptional regulator, AraC family [Ferruginibacter sp.]
MFQFSYKYNDHVVYLQNLADALGVPVINNTIWLPPPIGSGYIKVVVMANGLQVLINECTLNTDICFSREETTIAAYTIRFDQVRNMKKLTLEIGEDSLEEKNEFYSGAFLTNSLATLKYTTNAGLEDRCINIYFTEEWFNQFSGVKTNDYFFTQYLSLKTAAYTFEVLNIEYRELMEEIFFLQEDHPMYKTVLQNRVMLLLEKFLRSLYVKMTPSNSEKAVEEADIKKLMLAEAVLVNDLSTAPPSISDLAKIALMSETKLKASFKKLYGLNPYAYYQKTRMFKARLLITKRRFSVKETGRQLGFQNLSNFTIAYKKEFNTLPGKE